MAGKPIEDAQPACNGAIPAARLRRHRRPDARRQVARFFGTNTSRAIYEHVETLTGTMPESGAPPGGRELLSAAGPAQKP